MLRYVLTPGSHCISSFRVERRSRENDIRGRNAPLPGHYELHGSPLRPCDVLEVLTGSGWYWIAPGGSMVRVGEEMQARFQRQYLRAGWESEDWYDSEVLLERWSNGALDKEESTSPRACNGLVILFLKAEGFLA